jgi:hypothetical protein
VAELAALYAVQPVQVHRAELGQLVGHPRRRRGKGPH